MDTPQAPTGSLDLNQASQAFAAMLDPVEPKDDKSQDESPKAAEPEVKDEAPAEPNAQEEGDDAPSDPSDEKVTVLVDGKPVELTKEQIAEAHKAGLRQDDYTRKTQELAEQRKAVEAETAKARQERQQYAEGLMRANALIEGGLEEQAKIDWQALLDSDPVEYLRQQRIANERQAKWQENNQQLESLKAQAKAENEAALAKHVASQRELLLAKVPEWKDAAKMEAGVKEIKEYLKSNGYTDSEISGVHDHRAVINVRKAMLFDQMIAKAKVAEKKVQAAPQRVERPSNGEATLDRRSSAFQKLSKSGSIQDAAQAMAGLL